MDKSLTLPGNIIAVLNISFKNGSNFTLVSRGWSGGAMVLGKLPVPGGGVVGWCDGPG